MGFSSFLLILCVCTVVSFQYIMAGYINKCTEGTGDSGKVKEDICKQLCTNSTNYSCLDTGACHCDKEPTPMKVDDVVFVHCTNWNYVDQTECKGLCKDSGKNDTRVCWTILYKHYCTCFNNRDTPKPSKPVPPSLLFS